MHDDAPSLLLEVWPDVGTVETITPVAWDHMVIDLSRRHCP